jgi:hypothetical protein
MKQVAGFLVLVSVFVFSLAGQASAETVSISQQIIVQAKVLPAQYIIINSSNKITQIDSNTDQDITPKVYLGKVAAGNERQLTDEIYQEYRKLVPAGKMRVGTLYKQKKVPSAALRFAPVAFFSQKLW